ncbi:MAG: SRPBCC family protein [Streptosporangiaceae bacterium]
MTAKISATIEIAAPPEQVWAVLADLASYPDWNPVFRKASGQLTPGNRITITSTQPVTGHTMTVKVKVLTAEPAAELRWGSSVLGLMTGEHSFILSPTASGTQLVQTQTFRGLFTRFPPKTIGRIQASFEAINEAIRQRAEER